MARRPNAEATYNAAELFRTRCLSGAGSLLWPQARPWSSENLGALWSFFAEHPDVSDRSFFEKLHDQLAQASADVCRIAADILAFYYLFPSSIISAEGKAARLRTVIGWRDLADGLNFAPVEAAFAEGGIGNPGTYYNIGQPWLFQFLIALGSESLASKPDLADPKALQEVTQRASDRVPESSTSMIRNVTLHLLLPDYFERIGVTSHKEQILAAFASQDPQLGSIDDRILAVRKALAASTGRHDVDFYDQDIYRQWHRETSQEEPKAPGETGGRRSTVWIEKTHVRGQPHRETGENALGRAMWSPQRAQGGQDIYRFMRDVQAGDYVLHLTDNEAFTGVSRVAAPCQEFVGLPHTDWADVPAYRVQLQGFRKLEPPLSREIFFSARYASRLRALIDAGVRNLFYNSEPALNQGAYLTPAPPELVAILEDAYQSLAGRGLFALADEAPASNWIFQANPDLFDLSGALAELGEISWLVRQHSDKIHSGDTVFLWESGASAGVVALARIITDPADLPEREAEVRFNRTTDKFAGVQRRVILRIEGVLSERLVKSRILEDSELRSLTILSAPQGTNYRLTPMQADRLLALLSSRASADEVVDLVPVVRSFADGLRASHLSFGARHDDVVRAFVASLATKHFAILTGLSGSGKTQLAVRFGDWLGSDACLVLPVRPDWTGAEALFGYEDALQPPAPDGRRAWHAPDALRFMLRACRSPQRAFLLVLDEMNLAHVERYFADVLSGMESEHPCLPNLKEEPDGMWRILVAGPARIPVPRNLFVVGTVNVDETTYMFSPKVLDRANTFEFRVNTEDLSTDFRRPVPCEPAQAGLVRSFVTVALDDSWHIRHPATELNAFRGHMLTVHALLAEGGFEFGHRVFYEAVRFASILAAAGDIDPVHAFDLQVAQKVLPRLHGSRRRLEPVLCGLGQFCYELAFEPGSVASGAAVRFDPLSATQASPRLPVSFEKVRRMTRSVRANQFTSFTE